VNFNLANFSAADNPTIQYNLMTTLHEITHALGFSSDLFKKFIDENGNTRINHVIEFTNANGQKQKGLATPNVLAYARKFYGCDSWYVVPLENDGGGGTTGSHFERTLYFNEIMTGNNFFPNESYSGFTWSVLADSGWYGIDLKNADVFSAG